MRRPEDGGGRRMEKAGWRISMKDEGGKGWRLSEDEDEEDPGG